MVSRAIFVALAVVCTALQGAVAYPDAIVNDPAMLTKRFNSNWTYCYASCTTIYGYKLASAGYALCMRKCYNGYYP